MNYLAFIGVTAATAVVSCTPAKKEYASYELYPVRSGRASRRWNIHRSLPSLPFGRLLPMKSV